MTMSCQCKSKPKAFKGDNFSPYFKGMKEVAWTKDKWARLLQCSICGQHWQVDVWDKYSEGLAIKIDKPEQLKSYDDEPDLLSYLIESRGGVTDNQCQWQNCNENALQGLAYCPYHAYYKAGLRA